MDNTNSPKRIVFRFHFSYFSQESDTIDQFFAGADKPDFFIHSIPPNASTKMYTVLDVYHKDNPAADVENIPYEVFLVTKNDTLYVMLPIHKTCS